MEITQAYLRDHFNYDPFTGDFTRTKVVQGSGPAGKKNWAVGGAGYKVIGINYKLHSIHRIIWMWVFGEWPDEVDHINGDRLDNRLHNLRNVSRKENARNIRVGGSNTSGVLGVYWVERDKRWSARIGNTSRGGGFIGYYKTKAEAVAARKQAEIDLGYHKNHGRVA